MQDTHPWPLTPLAPVTTVITPCACAPSKTTEQTAKASKKTLANIVDSRRKRCKVIEGECIGDATSGSSIECKSTQCWGRRRSNKDNRAKRNWNWERPEHSKLDRRLAFGEELGKILGALNTQNWLQEFVFSIHSAATRRRAADTG